VVGYGGNNLTLISRGQGWARICEQLDLHVLDLDVFVGEPLPSRGRRAIAPGRGATRVAASGQPRTLNFLSANSSSVCMRVNMSYSVATITPGWSMAPSMVWVLPAPVAP
jgi:hypothetical protein